MKGNIIYPIITTVITAGVGVILEIKGFDFVTFFKGSPKECIFFIISVIIIVLAIIYDIFKGRLLKVNEELKEKEQEIQQLNNNLNETKSELDKVLKLQQELHLHRALNNYKKDNNT